MEVGVHDRSSPRLVHARVYPKLSLSLSLRLRLPLADSIV